MAEAGAAKPEKCEKPSKKHIYAHTNTYLHLPTVCCLSLEEKASTGLLLIKNNNDLKKEGLWQSNKHDYPGKLHGGQE